MCGITGWQLKKRDDGLTIYERTVMSITLAAEMENRGRDSFGAAMWFEIGQEPVVFKETGRIMLWGRDMMEAAILADQLIIHTRAATVGAISKNNSHPFRSGKTIGVHNGGVSNYQELNKELDRGFEVDSQHIFAHIEEGRDLNEVIAHGAVVYTQDNKTLKLAKFHYGVLSAARIYRERPTKSDEENHLGIVFASTQSAVTAAVERCGLYCDFLRLDDEKLYTLDGGEIYDAKKPFRPGFISKALTPNSTCGVMRTMGKGNPPTHDAKTTTVIVTDGEGKYLNKKERKRLKRLLRGEEKGYFSANTLFNNTGKLQKCQMFETAEDLGGNVHKIATCPDCNCDILLHHAGRCAEPIATCSKTHCPTFQACGSCGCFLVDQTHMIEHIKGEPHLFCEICQEECPIEQAKREYFLWKDGDDDEVVEAEVVSGPNPDTPPVESETEEVALTKITDADLADKTRLDTLIENYRLNGDWNLLDH